MNQDWLNRREALRFNTNDLASLIHFENENDLLKGLQNSKMLKRAIDNCLFQISWDLEKLTDDEFNFIDKDDSLCAFLDFLDIYKFNEGSVYESNPTITLNDLAKSLFTHFENFKIFINSEMYKKT